MNILIISQYYKPEKGGPIKRISGLAENLNSLGHNVNVLTGFPQYPSGEKSKDNRFKIYKKEVINGVNVFRTYEYSSPNKNFINRVLNYFSLTLSSMFFVFNKTKYDVVIVSSPPIFIGLSGLVISKLKGKPLVYDIRDIWPDIAVEMNEVQESDLTFKVMNKIANLLYDKSDLITVVTESKSNKLIEEKSINKEKIKVISNGFDSSFLDNEINENVVEKYNLENGDIFVYTGLVGLAQGLDLLVEAARKLKNSDNNIRILIVGDGPAKEDLLNKSKELGLVNIEFLGLVEPEHIYTFLKYAKASLIPLKNDNLKDSVPSKLYEALGVGCPVILSVSGEAAKIVRESDGGIVVPPNSSEEIKNAMLKILSEDDIFDLEKSSNYILNNYERKQITEKLIYSLQEVIE